MSELSTPQVAESATPPVGRRQRARRAVMMRWLVAGVGASVLSGLSTRASQAANGDAVLAGQP